MRTTINCDHEHSDHPEHHESIDWRHPADYIEPLAEEEHELLDITEVGKIPVGALRIFLQFLLPINSGPLRWKTVAARTAALGHALGVDGLGESSLTDLAREIGCSRALLSLLSLELRDYAGLASRGGRSDSARAAYGERAKRVWGRRGAQQAAEGGAGTGVHQDDSSGSTSHPRRGKRQAVNSRTKKTIS